MQPMGRRSVELWLLLAVLATSTPAAVVPRVFLEDLVNGSEWIVHGVVRESWSGWDEPTRIIWTHHHVEIRDALKGDARRSIVVSEPGGTVGGLSMISSGAVAYVGGEEVIVCLHRTPIGYLRSVGLGQGKYTVNAGGRVRAGLDGHLLVDPIGKPTPRRETAVESLDGLTVERFKARIRTLLNRPAAVAGR